MNTVILDSLLQLFEIEREKLFFLKKNILPFEDESMRTISVEALKLISDSILRIKEAILRKGEGCESDLTDLLNKTYLKTYRISYLLVQSDNYKKDRCVALKKMECAKIGFEILVFSL